MSETDNVHVGPGMSAWEDGLNSFVNVTNDTTSTCPICPDLLTLADLEEADGWRGRVIRGFFWLLDKAWRA